jgi:hypothetical protein
MSRSRLSWSVAAEKNWKGKKVGNFSLYIVKISYF